AIIFRRIELLAALAILQREIERTFGGAIEPTSNDLRLFTVDAPHRARAMELEVTIEEPAEGERLPSVAHRCVEDAERSQPAHGARGDVGERVARDRSAPPSFLAEHRLRQELARVRRERDAAPRT